MKQNLKFFSRSRFCFYITLIGFLLNVMSLVLVIKNNRDFNNFGVVDLNLVVNRVAKKMASQYKQENIKKDLMVKQVEEIKHTISIFANNHHINLFNYGTYLGGYSKDYTKDILQALELDDV
jgi:hypothetical protein